MKEHSTQREQLVLSFSSEAYLTHLKSVKKMNVATAS